MLIFSSNPKKVILYHDNFRESIILLKIIKRNFNNDFIILLNI